MGNSAVSQESSDDRGTGEAAAVGPDSQFQGDQPGVASGDGANAESEQDPQAQPDSSAGNAAAVDPDSQFHGDQPGAASGDGARP
jgi:hypothetical protein